ncbi:hypothetical protein J2T13_002344 [Paenibacillus sp. DS2015]|uniref:hypothetical protein n=1 Tax=Paenibacillus sp. DS2015 TaxID=3373917 RepID=UPI003D23B134
MKNNAITVVSLSIVAVIGGIVLNFQEFLMGNTATTKNVIVTLAYIAIWILVLVLASKNKSRIIMMYCLGFWIATLLFAMLTIYINVTEATVNWAIPFVIVLLGQWYGVMFLVGDFLIGSIIIAFISFGISTAVALLLRRLK